MSRSVPYWAARANSFNKKAGAMSTSLSGVGVGEGVTFSTSSMREFLEGDIFKVFLDNLLGYRFSYILDLKIL